MTVSRPYIIVADYLNLIEVNYLTSLTSHETVRALKPVLQDTAFRKLYDRTRARSTTQLSLPNSPKIRALLAAPSKLNLIEKLSELSKQQKICCRSRMTLRKLSLYTDLRPCGWKEAVWVTFRPPDPTHPSLYSRIPPTELARNRGLETGGKRFRDEAKAVL